jgi:hypothetical protein
MITPEDAKSADAYVMEQRRHNLEREVLQKRITELEGREGVNEQ